MTTSTARLAASAAIAALTALPAAALEIGFDDAEADLFLDETMFGVDTTGAHEGDLIVPEGYSETPDSAFVGEPVYFSDGSTPLGTVETVFANGEGQERIVILLAEGVPVAMADALYVMLPEGAEADGSITLDLTEEELVGISQNWAD
jgi:hypothetical protein